MPMYELFYSWGGHGGPYPNFREARKHARRIIKNCRGAASIQIKPRLNQCWADIKPVLTIRKEGA
jgi:hypothetical protein